MTNLKQTRWSAGPGGSAAAGAAPGRVFPAAMKSAPGSVYEIDPLSDARWAALVQNHPRSSVFHSSHWLGALHAVYGYAPLALTTSAPGSEVTNGFVFCGVNSWLTGRRFVSLPFSDHCEPLVDNSDQLDDMLLHIKQRVDDDNQKYIEIRPISYKPGAHTHLELSATYCFHELHLRGSLPEIFQSFHKDCVQRKIRRAERENLRYEEGTSEKLLREFYRLLVMTRRRQGLPPQPIRWFRGLIAAFGKDLKIRVAFKGELAVAGILTLSFKKSMIYKYGCSDASFHNMGGTALLFWNAIQEAKQSGFEELEMGRSDVDNLGLIAFKDHWGAKSTVIRYWSYPGGLTGPSELWKKKLAKYVVPALPDYALVGVGRFLYPHIG